MTLVVTTWNVENFASTSPCFAAKLDHLATVLRSLRPDVLCLQEVRDEQAVDKLALALDFAAAVVGIPDETGSRVATLLRGEPLEVHFLELQEGEALSRPSLHVVVPHRALRLHVLNAHLESKLMTVIGGRSLAEREEQRALLTHEASLRRGREALRLRACVNDLLADEKPTLLLGDLNDLPDAATTQLLYGPPGCQPRGPGDLVNAQSAFQRGDALDAQRLFNVTMLAPESDRWSRIAHGRKELLDHVLASAQLMPRVHGLRRAPTIEIRNGWTRTVSDELRADEPVPDHAPVSATFAV
jgi:endonuclease/exonuclease/phosphatase family metal-dependent hydrolase